MIANSSVYLGILEDTIPQSEYSPIENYFRTPISLTLSKLAPFSFI